jgi:hypothetical protein
MTTLHTIAVAAVIIGALGTGSTLVYRAAAQVLDPAGFVPERMAGRVRWWNLHVSAALRACVVLLVFGVIGLLGT